MNRYEILYHSGNWDDIGARYAKEEVFVADAPTAADALVMFSVEHPLPDPRFPAQGTRAFKGAEKIVCIREDLQIVLNLRGGQERVRS
jgi:hypothetical protein